MRFWQRAFLSILLLFVAFYYTGIFLVSDFAYRTSLNGERERSLGEAHFIASSLENEISAIVQTGGSIHDEGHSFFLRYANYYRNRDVYLELWQNDTLINGNIPDSPLIAYESVPGQQTSTVAEYGKRRYMLVVDSFWCYSEKYTLVYTHDLIDFTRENTALFRFLFLSGAALSTLLAAGLYLLLRRLSKPIEQLDMATGRIAGGNYAMRVPVRGKDELADLAKHFNRMTDEIEDRIRELKSTAEQKQRFIDNLAHELRTPLTTIRGYAEYLKNANINEDDRIAAIDFIVAEAARIEEMASKLLDLALMRNTGLETAEIGVPALFHAVTNRMSHKLLERKIRLAINCEQGAVAGDRVLLESLLGNLLDNAIKASQPEASIQLSGVKENGHYSIVIRDFGKGMSKEHIAKLTEPFYRVDKARSRPEGGAGLGLALCRQIAELHGAKLMFSSEVGNGTMVKIILTTP